MTEKPAATTEAPSAINQSGRPTGRGEMPRRLKVLSIPSRSDYFIYGRAGGQSPRLSLTPTRRPELAELREKTKAGVPAAEWLPSEE